MGCCTTTAVRDQSVYDNEIGFMEAASLETARAMSFYVIQNCCDSTGKLSKGEVCQDHAKLVMTVIMRVPYHADFMRFLGGITKNRPDNVPPGITPDSICTLEE